MEGPAGVRVWLVTSLQPDAQFLQQYQGSALVGLPPVAVRFAGTTDASGFLRKTQAVPSILTGASGLRVFVQPYYASPVVLGQGTAILAVDSSL